MKKLAVTVLICLSCITSVSARRLKIYSHSENVAPGQFAFVIFENPHPEQVIAREQCDAERLNAFTKQEVPILRIDQKGKQIFTSLGSYKTIGDSCVATWMVPVGLDAGDANLFILNGSEASTPYKITIAAEMTCRLRAIITPIQTSEQFTIAADGFVPVDTTDRKSTLEKLRNNFAYDKLSKPDQFTELNKKMHINWRTVTTGNTLTLTQGASSWTLYVESCGIDNEGVTLNFTCPPDIKSGEASAVLGIRYNSVDVTKSEPMKVTIQ